MPKRKRTHLPNAVPRKPDAQPRKARGKLAAVEAAEALPAYLAPPRPPLGLPALPILPPDPPTPPPAKAKAKSPPRVRKTPAPEPVAAPPVAEALPRVRRSFPSPPPPPAPPAAPAASAPPQTTKPAAHAYRPLVEDSAQPASAVLRDLLTSRLTR